MFSARVSRFLWFFKIYWCLILILDSWILIICFYCWFCWFFISLNLILSSSFLDQDWFSWMTFFWWLSSKHFAVWGAPLVGGVIRVWLSWFMLLLSCFVFYTLVCWPGFFFFLDHVFFLGFSCFWWREKDFSWVALDWLQPWVFLDFWVVHIIKLFLDLFDLVFRFVWLLPFLVATFEIFKKATSLQDFSVFLASKVRVLGPFTADFKIFVGWGCFFRLLLAFITGYIEGFPSCWVYWSLFLKACQDVIERKRACIFACT